MKELRQKVMYFAQRKLAWGVMVIIVTQVLGMLPALDFLAPKVLKLASFGLGCFLTIAKGVEMYFDQTAQLWQKEEQETERITNEEVNR